MKCTRLCDEEEDLMRHLAMKSELRSLDQSDALDTYIMKTKPQLKTYIMMRQLHYQQFAEGLTERKAARFVEQYAKAKAETYAKKSKYVIIARSDLALDFHKLSQ